MLWGSWEDTKNIKELSLARGILTLKLQQDWKPIQSLTSPIAQVRKLQRFKMDVCIVREYLHDPVTESKVKVKILSDTNVLWFDPWLKSLDSMYLMFT